MDEKKIESKVIPSGIQPDEDKDLKLISAEPSSKVHHDTIIQYEEELESTLRSPTRDDSNKTPPNVIQVEDPSIRKDSERLEEQFVEEIHNTSSPIELTDLNSWIKKNTCKKY